MPEVVFDSWLLDIHLVWKVFVNIPFHEGARIPSFIFQEFWDATIWNIIKLNVHFNLPSMVYPRRPHQVLVWERGLGGVLNMNGMGLWNPSCDWRKVQQILAPKEFIILKTFIIEQKPKMQHLHNSLKIDVVTWNPHYNTHIMI
jgi:hypothetical protein